MEHKGLTRVEVEERIARGLINSDGQAKTKSVRQIILEHSITLFNIVNVILAIAVICVGSFKNVLFMGVVIANTAIGVIQEIRSKRMVDKLSIMVQAKIEVIRDGITQEISAEEIVKDDVLHLKRGNQIPVDCIILSGEASVNESLVTGESDLIHKKDGDELVSGSFLAGGDCYVQVVRVGKDTFASHISSEAKVMKNSESEIMRTLKRIVTIISCILLPLGILLLMNQLRVDGATVKDAIVSTVAALITMIPEGLMLLTSSVLAVAVIRLSQKNVLVQQLYCIETLARVDVLCLDKTGTITTGRMQVVDLIPFAGHTQEECDQGFRLLSAVSRDEGSTNDAIRNCFGKDPGVTAERIIDFSSEKKWSGASFGSVTYVMGAGEMIFQDDFKYLENSIRSRIGTNRVITLAVTDEPFNDAGDLPGGLRPLGALLIRDEIRPQAKDTIRYFTEQGVQLKVISGDSVETVSHIAAAAGVPYAEAYIDARTLKTEEDIEKAAATKAVFGRVTPAQKRMLVRALQHQGHTVAMTGDGVNDVLAMKESDCSVSMASGSDAARSTAQLVLTTDDFSAMPEVVAEGRRSINNIQRSSSLFLTKTIFAILNSILFTFFALRYPFEPIQMSYISTLCIGIPSFVLALQPNRERVTGNFFVNIATKALSGGLTMFLGMLLVYLSGNLFHLEQSQISMLAVITTCCTLVFLLIRISIPFDVIRSILLGFVLIALFTVAFLFGGLLGFTSLNLTMILTALVVAAINGIVFFTLYNLTDRFRQWLLVKFPDDVLKENRRKKLEKKAARKKAQEEHAEERIKAWSGNSKGYQKFVRAIARPIAGIQYRFRSIKNKVQGK